MLSQIFLPLKPLSFPLRYYPQAVMHAGCLIFPSALFKVTILPGTAQEVFILFSPDTIKCTLLKSPPPGAGAVSASIIFTSVTSVKDINRFEKESHFAAIVELAVKCGSQGKGRQKPFAEEATTGTQEQYFII